MLLDLLIAGAAGGAGFAVCTSVIGMAVGLWQAYSDDKADKEHRRRNAHLDRIQAEMQAARLAGRPVPGAVGPEQS